MLYYESTDISEGIDLAKSIASKWYMICRYWFCHDLTILSVNISDIAIISIKNVDYQINVLFITCYS